MSKLAHSNEAFMDELDRLRFEDDDSFMYADWDLPEDNAKARDLVERIEGHPNLVTDCFAALVISVAVLLALYAVDAQPGKMLSMFSGTKVSDVVPTIYAPTGEWKRKP